MNVNEVKKEIMDAVEKGLKVTHGDAEFYLVTADDATITKVERFDYRAINVKVEPTDHGLPRYLLITIKEIL